jgi:cell division transport system permease protein
VSVADTLSNLRSNRGTLILSVLVIGVTLALPLGLHVVQENFVAVVSRLGSRPQATLFLELKATRADAEALADALRPDRRFEAIHVIDKDEALSEFKQFSGLDEVIDTLIENPLPHTLVIDIDPAQFEGEAGRRLEAELEQTAGVAGAQFDITWIRRLRAISDLAARAAVVFATILAVGVVLVTGNTIRVGIHNRRDEIEVAKLCGATDAFVRRPFLYNGAFQGLLGAFIACAIVAGAIALLSAPAEELAGAYDSNLQLLNLTTFSFISVLISGAVLGWLGAWIAVSVYLRRIDVTRSD